MFKAYNHKAFNKSEKEKIDQYIDLALNFNKTHNLFARKNKPEILNKDILDCAHIIPAIKPNKTVADLGSGGGLPGILLSITKPPSFLGPILIKLDLFTLRGFKNFGSTTTHPANRI